MKPTLEPAAVTAAEALARSAKITLRQRSYGPPDDHEGRQTKRAVCWLVESGWFVVVCGAGLMTKGKRAMK